MKRRLWGLSVVVALLLMACGDDGNTTTTSSGSGSASSSSALEITGDPDKDDCLQRLATAMNELDVRGVTVNEDGTLDEADHAILDPRLKALEKKHAELREDSPCMKVLESLNDSQADAFVAEIRPAVGAVMGASARKKFKKVAEPIN